MLLLFIKQLLKNAPEMLADVIKTIEGMIDHGWTQEQVDQLKADIAADGHEAVDAEVDQMISDAFPEDEPDTSVGGKKKPAPKKGKGKK